MKALRFLFFIVIYLAAVNACAQKVTPKFIEDDLLKSFKTITYWADKNRNADSQDNSEKLDQANAVFGKKLSGYAKNYPGTIAQAFPSLIKQHLDIQR